MAIKFILNTLYKAPYIKHLI